ncbi:MAG: hypothetical protein LBM66_03725 [Bifidobacteriaceae bacterium]|jgi:hypothetical protein|nr:hypothetical protein [Bifidobacteriaceae bacterium]
MGTKTKFDSDAIKSLGGKVSSAGASIQSAVGSANQALGSDAFGILLGRIIGGLAISAEQQCTSYIQSCADATNSAGTAMSNASATAEQVESGLSSSLSKIQGMLS